MTSLIELQNIAEKRGEELFMTGLRACLHCTLLATQDAMKDIDEIKYASPYLIKATNGLPAGIWAGTGSCGVVLAGAIALSLKYGTEDYDDAQTILQTGMKARQWYHWFNEQFDTCDCHSLSGGTDFSDMADIQAWNIGPKKLQCNEYVKTGVRQIIDDLTKEDNNVKRP